jgi:hypothetical protein
VIYDGGDKLFVPVENIDVLSRYGGEETIVALDKMGGAAWQARKARVKQRIRDIANAADEDRGPAPDQDRRRAAAGRRLFDEFCARFPYAETEDQQRAIVEVIGDLANGRPMDRLVCGDVGFRQDRGGAARGLRRRHVRQAGRGGDAHDAAVPSAFQDLHRALPGLPSPSGRCRAWSRRRT